MPLVKAVLFSSSEIDLGLFFLVSGGWLVSENSGRKEIVSNVRSHGRSRLKEVTTNFS